MANNYLTNLAAINERRIQFNEWTARLHKERDIPPTMPLVLREGTGDAELEDYLAEGQAMMAAETAFFEKYGKPGVDPHTVED
jgi:hypothetical protein